MTRAAPNRARTAAVIVGIGVALAAGGSQVARSESTRLQMATPKAEAAAAAAVAEHPRVENLQATKPVARSAAAPQRFTTPTAAMRYLAAAYNDGDDAALQKVTAPSARAAMGELHAVAARLRLERCDRDMDGMYLCSFVHGRGQLIVGVDPSPTSGWRLTEVFTSS